VSKTSALLEGSFGSFSKIYARISRFQRAAFSVSVSLDKGSTNIENIKRRQHRTSTDGIDYIKCDSQFKKDLKWKNTDAEIMHVKSTDFVI